MLGPDSLLQNRYLIVRELGRGGMGAVYEARDQRLKNTVALKEAFFTTAELGRAFEREARLLSNLRHPALPRVTDYFQDETGSYLVMDFVPGEDLAALLAGRREPFPVGDVLRWADQILSVLEYLHGQPEPIIHRDVKPQNLKLTPAGDIVLLDFGLSKGSAAEMSRLTGGRSVAGFTPHFAPLEQIHGKGTDPRSDLYSTAATLYCLLTGQIPADAIERAHAASSEEPDPLRPANELNPSVPQPVAALLDRALAPNPKRRPTAAGAMREELRNLTKDFAPARPTDKLTTLPLPEPEPPAEPAKPDLPAAVEGVLAETVRVPATTPLVPPSPARDSFTEEPKERARSRAGFLAAGALALLGLVVGVGLLVPRPGGNASPLVAAPSASERLAQGVAATVDGVDIRLDAVDRAVKEQGVAPASLSAEAREAAQLKELDALIQQEALYQRAKREGLEPTASDVDAEIRMQMSERNMTEDAFREFLRQSDLTEDAFRDQARRQLAVARLEDRAKLDVATPTDAEVMEFFAANREKLVAPRGVELSDIIVDPNPNGESDDATTADEAKRKALEILAALRSGSDFANLARARSEDAASAPNGGAIGFFSEADLERTFPADLVRRFFSLSPGQITEPIRAKDGRLHIFKLTAKREYTRPLTFEEVKPEVVRQLVKQRTEVVLAKVVTETVTQANVTNFLAQAR